MSRSTLSWHFCCVAIDENVKFRTLHWRHNDHDGADQRKHQSSASLAFVWGIHRGPVNSPHKGPVTRKMFPFDDVIMIHINLIFCFHFCSLIIYAHTFIKKKGGGGIVWYWETCWKCVYINKYYATGTPKTFLYFDFWRRRGNFKIMMCK